MLQPHSSILELCHVVTDMDAALQHWTQVLGAGPFFVGEMEFTEGQFHRGVATPVALQVAFGCSGGLIIELVKPLGDHPSVFREVLESRGPGYHHVMPRIDYDTGFERFNQAGYDLAFQGSMPGGERCALFDTRADNGGFIELMDMSPAIVEQLQRISQAHFDWDGHSDPVRPLASLFV
ncbi:VOC family protein [Pseudomonas sp. LB3P14]